MTVQAPFAGIVKRAYVPAGTGLSAKVTSLLKVILVAVLAPVRHILSNGTRPSQILRPLTPGQLYSTVTSVRPTCCVILAVGLGRGRSRSARAAAGTRRNDIANDKTMRERASGRVFWVRMGGTLRAATDGRNVPRARPIP